MARLSTPYYLAGEQKKRFHASEAEKSAITAAGLGAIGYGLKKPKYQQLAKTAAASRGVRVGHTDLHTASKLFLVGGAAVGAYSGLHAARAAHYKHREMKRTKAYYQRSLPTIPKSSTTVGTKTNGRVGKR